MDIKCNFSNTGFNFDDCLGNNLIFFRKLQIILSKALHNYKKIKKEAKRQKNKRLSAYILPEIQCHRDLRTKV